MTLLAVLGSTGSVGTATLDVVRRLRERFTVAALAAGSNVDLLAQQAAEFQPSLVSIATEEGAARLRAKLPAITVLSGPTAMVEIVHHDCIALVVVAAAGIDGLAPAIAAVRSGKDLAIANKEILVAAGDLVLAEAHRSGSRLTPIDSEMSALAQILDGCHRQEIDTLVLTASGGPFRTWPPDRMASVSVADALNHPTWRMGRKISVDSATMMNKGLEIIEASRLFDLPEDRIDVVVHPQSVVHALVRFTDGSLMAQLAAKDMRQPILRALLGGTAETPPVPALDLVDIGRLDFEPVDSTRFPAVSIAREALRSGGEMPAVLSAADEVAVHAFLAGHCSFNQIPGTIADVMERWTRPHRDVKSVEQALAVDAEARRMTAAILGIRNDT